MSAILALAMVSTLAQLPFTLQLDELPCGGDPPPLHSFCLGRSQEKFLLLAGRTGGMHTFRKGTNNFPPSSQNYRAYVLDPSVPRFVGSFDLKALGPALADPLSSTNAEWVQVGDFLYLVGGYGQDSTTNRMVTFGTITRIEVGPVIQAIARGNVDPCTIARYIRQTRDPRLAVAGGSLHAFGSQFALVFGNSFQGAYTGDLASYDRAVGFQQTYTEGVWSFFVDTNLNLSKFVLCQPFLPDLPFNRRDFTALGTILPDGTRSIIVYGGVFRAGTLNAFLNPVVITPNPRYSPSGTYPTNPDPFLLTVDTRFSQALSQYNCASFMLYDPTSRESYATLFGGISRYYCPAKFDPTKLQQDSPDPARGIDGLPFVDSISTIARHPDGSSTQYVWPFRLPALMGADALFLPSSAVDRDVSGFLRIDSVKSRTFVGWVYGGIVAERPYSVQGPTRASNRLFRVSITPTPTTLPAAAVPNP
ncbi:MAG: hypothetical protein U0790_10325 [Isosphaeraceae bacterium]